MNILKLIQECNANLMLAPEEDSSIFPVFGDIQKKAYKDIHKDMHHECIEHLGGTSLPNGINVE